jgi:hypothetical protein
MSAADAAKWQAIQDAYDYVLAGSAKRIDGAGFSVYMVGANVVRVDVRVAS